jgi:hypothetical protein
VVSGPEYELLAGHKSLPFVVNRAVLLTGAVLLISFSIDRALGFDQPGYSLVAGGPLERDKRVTSAGERLGRTDRAPSSTIIQGHPVRELWHRHLRKTPNILVITP